MEKKRKSITFITILVTAAAIWVSLSSFNFMDKNYPPIREEVKEYILENVIPVIREQRTKLNHHLSSEEALKIDGYRSELNEYRNMRNTLIKDLPKGSPSDMSLEKREEMMENRKEQMRAHRKIMIEVFGIVDKHEDEIDGLLGPIEEKMPQWMEDIRKIISESKDHYQRPYNGNNSIRRGFGAAGGPGYRGFEGAGGPGYRGFGGAGGPGYRAYMGGMFPLSPERFVLFDPESIDGIFKREFSISPSLYPNPSNGMVNIDIDIDKQEHVLISLYDRQGTRIKDLINKNLDKGDHELIFDLSDLSNGIYFYHIHINEEIQKGRIIIE
jgi:hypothetical protein